MFLPAYGNSAVRTLTSESFQAFCTPGEEFVGTPLLKQRGMLYVARAEQLERLHALLADIRDEVSSIAVFDGAKTRELFPLLRPGYAAGALWDPIASDIDVHALQQGHLRKIRQYGGTVVTNLCFGDTATESDEAGWRIRVDGATVKATTIVNAAGAWADQVAAHCDIAPLGLQPKRRTAFTIDIDEKWDFGGWPLLLDIDEQFYAKPDAGAIMGSPADSTPCDPCDVQPEELDLAIGVARLEQALDISVQRLRSQWAGLRTFAPDETPVIGADPANRRFFWLAGQGGFGIQTVPAASLLAASLIMQEGLAGALGCPELIAAVSPARLRARGGIRQLAEAMP